MRIWRNKYISSKAPTANVPFYIPIQIVHKLSLDVTLRVYKFQFSSSWNGANLGIFTVNGRLPALCCVLSLFK